MPRILVAFSLAAVFIALCSSVADTAPLSLTESDDFGPDFLTIGTLGVGVNTIRGNVSTPTLSSVIEVDTFALNLPAGLIVTSGVITISNYFSCFETPFSSCNPVVNGFLEESLQGSVSFADDLTLPLSPAAPYSENVIVASFRSPLGEGPCRFCSPFVRVPRGGAYDYTLQYTVEAVGSSVPEPATLPLLALGMTGLTIAARQAWWRAGSRTATASASR